MKKLMLLLALTLTVTGSGYADSGATDPCVVASFGASSYGAPDFSCTIGDLTFSNFSYTSFGPTALSGEQIMVTPATEGGEAWLVFTGAWVAQSDTASVSDLSYTVTAPTPVISNLSLSIQGYASNGSGFGTVVVTASNFTNLLVCFGISWCEGLQFAHTTFDPVSSLTISEEIVVRGGPGDFDFAALSLVENGTSGPIPINTQTGIEVSVQPTDTTTATSPVSLTFSSVTQGGSTTLTTSNSGTPPPEGFALGDPPTYFDLSTTAVFSGPVTVCINYSGLGFDDATQLALYHLEDSVWVDRTTSLDTVDKIICGSVTSFSPFGIFKPVPVANAGPDQTVQCASPTGTAVRLDGAGSHAHEGDVLTLTYAWTGPFPEGGGTVTGVSPTVTLPLGTSTIKLVVNDGAMNSVPSSVKITVVVKVVGLEPPLAALVPEGSSPILPGNAFKQGRTLPLKLKLLCCQTVLTDANVAPPFIVSLVSNGAPINLTVVDVDAGQANDNGNLFRLSLPDWVYNLSTRNLAAGTYTITIQMPDGQRFSGGFVLK